MLGRPELILGWPWAGVCVSVGGEGVGGAAQQFLALTCFYNSLSTDLCPLTGLSWEFLSENKLVGS